jgi:TRAP-type C4-dicarboxylate transport system permease small subunit
MTFFHGGLFMNKIKHYFYLSSVILSGSCLVMMTLLILAQIIARSFGQVIPSSEDFAGWLLSATIFFGLAYTFHHGGHIRVTMLLSRLSPNKRRLQEFFNLLTGLLISAYFAFYSIVTVYDSYDYEEVTETYLAMPLWIVQTPMAVGALFLFMAMLDSFIEMLAGRTPLYISSENELSGEG